MSCNKSNCCKKNNLPREEMNLDAGAVFAAFAQLMRVAKTGVDGFQWGTAELAQIAQLIVTLARKPEPVPAPDVSVTEDALTLRFGPQNTYALHVPAGNEKQRSALIAQLVQAIAQLSPPPSLRVQNPNQLPLPFSSES
jgi:hypothetical protein